MSPHLFLARYKHKNMSEITCECFHCHGKMSFEESEFQTAFDSESKRYGQEIQCPHCGKSTRVYRSLSSIAFEMQKKDLSNLTIGDISIKDGKVMTPNGIGNLSDSQWGFSDTSRTETKIPAVAIILAVLFTILLCGLGLLFLLMKKKETSGYVEVSVHAGNLFHKAQIPVKSQEEVDLVRELVSKAQSLAMQARNK